MPSWTKKFPMQELQCTLTNKIRPLGHGQPYRCCSCMAKNKCHRTQTYVLCLWIYIINYAQLYKCEAWSIKYYYSTGFLLYKYISQTHKMYIFLKRRILSIIKYINRKINFVPFLIKSVPWNPLTTLDKTEMSQNYRRPKHWKVWCILDNDTSRLLYFKQLMRMACELIA